MTSLPVSERLCRKRPGLPSPELEARCRPTKAWLSMVQPWLGNSPSPSAWLKTRAGNSRHVGLNSCSTHMWHGRREYVVCVSKCAWIPINCVWEGGYFSSSSHLVLTCPSTVPDFRGNNPSLPSSSDPRPEAWELEGTAQYPSRSHTLLDRYLRWCSWDLLDATPSIGSLQGSLWEKLAKQQIVSVTFKQTIIPNLYFFHCGGLCHKSQPKAVVEINSWLFPNHAVICHVVYFRDFPGVLLWVQWCNSYGLKHRQIGETKDLQ